MHESSVRTTAAFLERFKQAECLSIEEVEASFARSGKPFSKYYAPYKVTPTGKSADNFETTTSSCAFGEVEMVCSRWGAPMLGTALGDTGTISIGIPISGVTELHDPRLGKIVTKQHEARIFRAGTGVSMVGLGPRTVLDLVLPYTTLNDRVKSFHQDELNDPLQFDPVIDLRGAGGQMIMNLVEYVKMLMLNEPEAVKQPLVAASLQEHLISTVLELLPNNYNETKAVAAPCAVPKSVRKAEEFMRAHAHMPITVEDLAKHAGCSERALHNAFRSFRQCSPMSALRNMRLEGAHNDLKSGDGAIAEIGFKWGFSNPGRFAKLYAEKFGCKPSQTRRFGASPSR